MANETVTSGVSGLIPADMIGDFIQALDRPARLGEGLAWKEQGTIGVAYRFPRWNDFTQPAGNTTEGAAATRVAMTTSENTATPAFVAFEIAITDEAAQATEHGLPAGLIVEALDKFADRKDKDLLSVSTSATQIAGADTDLLTEANALAAVALWKTLEQNSGTNEPVMVVCHGAAASIRSAVQTSAAASKFQSSFGENISGSLMGTFSGMQVWETGNVAVTGGGHSNFITRPGNRQCGIGVVECQGVTVETNRGSEGAREGETYYVFRAGYGTTVTNVLKILEVLTV